MFELLAAYCVCGQLIDRRIVCRLFQLLELIAVQLLDIGTILFDQIGHIHHDTRIDQTACRTFCKDDIRIFLLSDHQCN